MKWVDTALGGLLVMACAGCPGTIEDRTSFEGLGQAARVDSGSGVEQDAAAPVQDAGSDASESVAEDAASSPDPDAGDDAGWAALDAAPEPDAAGAQPDAGESGGDADLGCDFEALIKAQCGDSGCHGAPAVANGLDLTSPDLGARLAGRSGTGSCSTFLLIDPAQPEQSALYLKVTPDKCGSRMPLGNTLTDGEQACILKWIKSL